MLGIGLREETWKQGGPGVIWVNQMSDSNGSNQSGSLGGGERRSDSGYMVKIQPK